MARKELHRFTLLLEVLLSMPTLLESFEGAVYDKHVPLNMWHTYLCAFHIMGLTDE